MTGAYNRIKKAEKRLRNTGEFSDVEEWIREGRLYSELTSAQRNRYRKYQGVIGENCKTAEDYDLIMLEVEKLVKGEDENKLPSDNSGNPVFPEGFFDFKLKPNPTPQDLERIRREVEELVNQN